MPTEPSYTPSHSYSALPTLERELELTRRVLERLPEDQFGWQPHVKSMTLGELGSHTANLFGFMAPLFAQPEHDLAADPAAGEPPAATTRAELLQRLETNGQAARAGLAVGPEAYTEVWTLRHGPQVLVRQPRAEVLRQQFLDHLIHHRAQLTVYLRLLDVPVPGLYGPTADEPAAS